MLVLGLETSCDETAVGIVSDAADFTQRIKAHVIASQVDEHRPYGGVVPEIAARAHLEHIDVLVRQVITQAGITLNDLDAIAATCGPGLIGGVMIGAMTGKALAASTHKPFIAVNHLEAHALTVRLTHPVVFPYLLLLVSGGHCQLLIVHGVGSYHCLGSTIDDAVGECFDKGAKLLGLGYPGGPLLEQAAKSGNPQAFLLPRPMVGNPSCVFSFSGLKTALRQLVVKQGTETLSPRFVADAAASLQFAIRDILVDRTRVALDKANLDRVPLTTLVVAGGVAANMVLRRALMDLAIEYKLPFVAPPVALCTDNGAMVAWAGLERFRLGLTDFLATPARPRWPLDATFSSGLAGKTGTG